MWSGQPISVRLLLAALPLVGCAGLADPISAAVVPAAPGGVYRAVHDLYVDAAGPLRFPDGEDAVTLDLAVDDADGALAVAEVARAGRGTVIDVAASGGGGFSIRPAGGERLTLFGMGGASEPGDFAGELQFDLYVFGDGTDPASSLKVGLDSGDLDAGAVDLPFARLTPGEGPVGRSPPPGEWWGRGSLRSTALRRTVGRWKIMGSRLSSARRDPPPGLPSQTELWWASLASSPLGPSLRSPSRLDAGWVPGCTRAAGCAGLLTRPRGETAKRRSPDNKAAGRRPATMFEAAFGGSGSEDPRTQRRSLARVDE